MRKILAIAAASTLACGTWAVAPTAAQEGGGCVLEGTARFAPKGPGTSSRFSYRLAGRLTDCVSSATRAPGRGRLLVGATVTVKVPIKTGSGVVRGTAKYRLPRASGSGNVPVNSCASSTTKGVALVNWAGGTRTIVAYTTESGGAAVPLEGTVIRKVVGRYVPGSARPRGTPPARYTFRTTQRAYPVGSADAGFVLFITDAPVNCTTARGLRSVDVLGIDLFGNP